MTDGDMTRSEYWAEVRSLAQSIREDAIERWDNGNGDDWDEALSEAMYEAVDGHQWVIYTAYNFDVLRFSENEGYSVENFGIETVVSDGAIHWAMLAYGALYGDVCDTIDHDEPEIQEPEEADA